MKIFQGKNLPKLYFDNLSIHVSQSKTMQVERILHILELSGHSSHKIKSRRFLQYLWGVFNKTIIQLVLVGYEMIIANEACSAELAIYHLISNVHLWNNYC